MTERRISWVRLGVLAVLFLLPTTCWAHGGLQGLGAVMVAVFAGGPMAAILLVLSIVLVVLLVKRKHSRGVRIYARVVQGLAIAFQILLPVITFAFEFNDASRSIGGMAFAGLLIFSAGGFALAEVLARRCLCAEAGAR